MIAAADTFVGHVGVATAWSALCLPRSVQYRDRAASLICPLPTLAIPALALCTPLALSVFAGRVALDVLESARFPNCAPAARDDRLQTPIHDQTHWL